ncbi:MAG: diguanylate cyclase [Acidimicrobiales bacterium]|nr:diguanylate cyclase [Acidimicrobiales bacterium]
MTNPHPSDPPAPTPAVKHRFETLAEALAVAILTADPDGSVDYVNPAARELFWREERELMGDGWLAAVHADDRLEVAACATNVCNSGNADRADFRIDVAGYNRWVRARLNPLPATDGGSHGWVAIFDDVTADRATSEELARRAAHDPLTGLPNRALLRDRLEHAIARCRRAKTAVSVFFLDLDDFKPINDRLGHKAGDQVLREVGERIRRATRSEDTAARLGGDEFVVVAEGLDHKITTAVAERLAVAISQPIRVDGERVTLTVSIGVAWAQPPLITASAMVDLADQAMYEAKRSDSPVAFADPAPSTAPPPEAD